MRMKKYVMTLALCIAAGVMLTLPVQADAKSTGKLTKNIKWSLNSDETVLTITGKGTVDIRKFRKEGRYKWPGSEAGQPAILTGWCLERDNNNFIWLFVLRVSKRFHCQRALRRSKHPMKWMLSMALLNHTARH